MDLYSYYDTSGPKNKLFFVAKIGRPTQPKNRTRPRHMERTHTPHPPKILELWHDAAQNVRAELSSQGKERYTFHIIPVRYYKYYIAIKQELWTCPKIMHKNE